jgi:hypothetical protein
MRLVLPGRARGQCGEGLLRRVDILVAHRLAQRFRAGAAFGKRRCRGGMQHFAFSSAMFLDAVDIAIQDLENRQRLQFGRKLLRQIESGICQLMSEVQSGMLFARPASGRAALATLP